MILPKRLKEGDKVGIVAPAGPPNREKVNKSVTFFEQLGLSVQFGKYLYDERGYLSAGDEQRLEDFHEMIADSSIKAIFFARGGYGTARIVDQLDMNLIGNNPKIIWGYSDITYLHTAIRQATGLVSFHGPMAASDIVKADFDRFSGQLFKQLFKPTQLIYSEKVSPLYVYTKGIAKGEVVGGNLSLLVSSMGTSYEIDTKNKLLLIEDIGEEPYRVDSMLNQLRLAGKLEDAAGIIVGDFSEAEPTVQPSLSLTDVFDDYFRPLGKPVIGGFKIGHCFPHFSMPLGVVAELSSESKSLTIDPGVK
ncbi:LD-carboxypeptidase [Oceanobacillus iheyensis]|uniref:Hypothetical conserved protein n=1 Tax=Oceanobacillus iheyensis (strain DSM 14371 / CIP 107618 / JCM 11309 / KCTC 3954 / HTE831) TaxID=221109 RepID=Q8EM92_OCEIH|nr:LD-carboxypeptidase [Oceanobacillus iheyensis]BAC14922.1 hypothetical conserved protein [Oceanobacillus iheyensis HTE831]